MHVPHHEKADAPHVERRSSLDVMLSALLSGTACDLLVADLLAAPIVVGWTLLLLAVGMQFVALLRRSRQSAPQAYRRPPGRFWLALLVMLAAFALLRLFGLV